MQMRRTKSKWIAGSQKSPLPDDHQPRISQHRSPLLPRAQRGTTAKPSCACADKAGTRGFRRKSTSTRPLSTRRDPLCGCDSRWGKDADALVSRLQARIGAYVLHCMITLLKGRNAFRADFRRIPSRTSSSRSSIALPGPQTDAQLHHRLSTGPRAPPDTTELGAAFSRRLIDAHSGEYKAIEVLLQKKTALGLLWCSILALSARVLSRWSRLFLSS